LGRERRLLCSGTTQNRMRMYIRMYTTHLKGKMEDLQHLAAPHHPETHYRLLPKFNEDLLKNLGTPRNSLLFGDEQIATPRKCYESLRGKIKATICVTGLML
jgi:hypothetical protein